MWASFSGVLGSMKKRATITVTVAAGNAINRKEMIQEGGRTRRENIRSQALLHSIHLLISTPSCHHASHGSAMFG